MPRLLFGSLVGAAASVAMAVAMLPLRSHIAVATAALVFVLPVLAGVTSGGFVAGLVSVAAGFLAYDYAYIPPYGTLTVGELQNWVALGVYSVVMIVVARLVSHLHDAEDAAATRAAAARQLLDLSELMLTERPGLPDAVVASIRDGFGADGVALMQEVDGRLRVVASAGVPLSEDDLAQIGAEGRLPIPLTTGATPGELHMLALVSSSRPIGLVVLRNCPTARAVRDALTILANHLAITLERAELRQHAHRAELLEEVDRLRQSVVGAVSHDLRTPLATIKVASSTLVDADYPLSEGELAEIYALIDQQADRLDRLVANLLDMTRIQAGVLEVHRRPVTMGELLADATSGLRSSIGEREVRLVPESATELMADADQVLVSQVLANLIDNANRLAPAGTPITIEVRRSDDTLRVAVMDDGPGVPASDREAIFETFVRYDTGGRSGLGLAIAKAFIEAHGDRIWVEDVPEGGANFAFTLRAAEPVPDGTMTTRRAGGR